METDKTKFSKFIDFLEIQEIKNGYFNFIKYIKVNLKLCFKSIKKFFMNFLDRFKFYTYKYWYYKKHEKYFNNLFYQKHDHFFELIQLINDKLKLLKVELQKDYDFDPKDMERLDDIINLGDQLLNIIETEGLVEKNKEYQKLSKSYFNKLYRLHDKLYSIKDFQNIEI